jgi:putative glutamine amidotransferase
MSAALIGLTTYRTKNTACNPVLALATHYAEAISQAGGIPVLIPLGLPKAQLHKLSTRLDGILLSGGGDMHPATYGQENNSAVKGVDPDRDRVEIELVQMAIADKIPFLGICRGIQVINVALGGSLYSHIADQHPGAVKHDYYPDWPRDHLPHGVRIEPGSRLASILGTLEPQVNSLHHQGIRDLAPKLQATGWAPDALIEAIELPEHPFGVAVQWHPEWLTGQLPMQTLFRAFIEAAAT